MRRGGAQRKRALLLLAAAAALVAASVVILRAVGWPAVLSFLAAAAALIGSFAPLIKAGQAMRASREKADEQRRSVEADRDQAVRERAGAEAKLADITSGRYVDAYFARRAASGDYQSRLGLLTTIRRDFADLREWLLQGGSHGRAARIERIVLYIADLDRCNAARVVKVLEAIHLLLALDLFVVVVAVDPHWLLSSLAEQYSQEFGAVAPEYQMWQTTPQQYLEKIFQIPFNLMPMNTAGFARIISSLLPSRPDGQPDPALSAEVPSSRAQDEPPGERQQDILLADAVTARYSEDPPVGLIVDPRETDFMCQLNALIPTPRAAKRYTYRLIRAPLTGEELRAFVGAEDEPGPYRGVMLLLAIMIGYPAQAERIFSALAESDGASWVEVLDKSGLASDSRPAELAETLTVLFHRLEPLPEPGRMKPWLPAVSRYSFRSIMSPDDSVLRAPDPP